MATAVPMSRIQALTQLRCKIFNHSYNPTNTRTGAKVLRQRLRGPALAAYYPRKILSFRDIEEELQDNPSLETFDEDEMDRFDDIALRKARGKGAPKKKRTAEESKKFSKKRPGGK